jgi:hypothetical protein
MFLFGAGPGILYSFSNRPPYPPPHIVQFTYTVDTVYLFTQGRWGGRRVEPERREKGQQGRVQNTKLRFYESYLFTGWDQVKIWLGNRINITKKCMMTFAYSCSILGGVLVQMFNDQYYMRAMATVKCKICKGHSRV